MDFQGLVYIEKYNLNLPLLSDIDAQKDNRWQAKQREDINLNHSTTDSKVANKVPLFLFLFRPSPLVGSPSCDLSCAHVS